MLELDKILWVVPGIVIIFIYNRRRINSLIELSGWNYIFCLVTMAVFTWLPSQYIVGMISHCPNLDFVEPIHRTLICSLLLSVIIGILLRVPFISKSIFPQIYDNFYNRCMDWEEKLIILSLKNNKTYVGILWKYPENPTARHESQTISIVPYLSGYRDEASKKVVWNTSYPEYETIHQTMDMEVIIPRSEIITLGKFNERVFEYFNKGKIS